MVEKGAISIPIEERLPLLGDNVHDQRPARGCTRGIFCKRCVVGTHEDSKKRFFLRRMIAGMLLAWIYFAIFGYRHSELDRHGGKHHHHHHDHEGGHGHNNKCVRKDLVPWERGPSKFGTSAKNISLRFGNGNMFSKVDVVSSGDVMSPMILVNANVTKARRHCHHPQGHDDGVKDTVSTKQTQYLGLHIDVDEQDDEFSMTIWADDHLEPDHGQDHPDDPDNDHHRCSFCAGLEVVILLPESFTTFGRLFVEGVVMDFQAQDLGRITFDTFSVSTTVGAILFQSDLVIATEIFAHSITGAVEIASVTAPAGKPLKVKVTTTVGAIDVNAVLPRVVADAEDQNHEIDLSTVTGLVQIDVKAADEDILFTKKGTATVPGDAQIRASSDVGQIITTITLADDQLLFLNSKSTTGQIDTTVDDKFLGNIRVQTDMSRIDVFEAEGSKSEIEYEKNSKQLKVGHKHLKDNGDDTSDENDGDIVLRSGFGQVVLTFV
ncbi:hypothetical protein BGZ98_008850 [Dissophora globulifera]|nr:hypothetical protein BGZ98_008850 [Dissophora globulifera]